MSTLPKPSDTDLESGNGGDVGNGGRNVSVSMEVAGRVSCEIVERGASTGSYSLDLEDGGVETKPHLGKTERDCRICHLSMDASIQEFDFPIELGCSCKDDLAAAHKQCAEAWFKIKGNKICEICGSIAQNVGGVNESEMSDSWNGSNEAAARATASTPPPESRNFWQGHRFLNFLLACMVFAFIISWLFHFNVPS